MRKLSLKVLLPLFCTSLVASSAIAATQLQGAGATFRAPLYQRWIAEFGKANPDIQINYQGIGSGAGIKQFTQGLLTFGASDAAMTDDEIAKVKKGVVLVPATAGSIVLAFNLPGVESLRLSREAYVGIFLGKVSKWNDPLIARSNPGAKLPDLPITVCTRSDGSGTNFIFTQHLSAVSPEFKDKVGKGTTVTWPTGVAGKGNDGVTALVKQSPGGIGYVEYGYAVNNKLTFAELENKAGQYVKATAESGAATLSTTQFDPGTLRGWPLDPDGKDDYPIASFTWLLLFKTGNDKTKLDALKKFVAYGLSDGQKFSNDLGYIPLPEDVVAKATDALKQIQ